ncbi:MAG: diacylglycerol/lipid kinase family protein [Oscillospiraceae bacterium]
MKIFAAYNPKANNGMGLETAKGIEAIITADESLESAPEFTYIDLTEQDINHIIDLVGAEDYLVIAGGDGTLNFIANTVKDWKQENHRENYVLYYPSGSGNDMQRDAQLKGAWGLTSLIPYLTDLPEVTVNGITRKFINGIGYGIDGYCCEEGDRQRAVSTKKVDYTSIAIQGLLFRFKPCNAKVTVDGELREYHRVWLAPAMNGRCYGGGMIIAPAQDRFNKERLLSSVVVHNGGKLRILTMFPKIFKGEHVSLTKIVDIRQGREITVEFDRPTALQIDGETVRGVMRYTVKSSALVQSTETEDNMVRA